ncbi:MAG TPA: MBL fold metallo-hydrolase [Burkholderiaceae bacterium]|nr:MBL fold metallo-hydrolase [Burkholderiaceae bacterium]
MTQSKMALAAALLTTTACAWPGAAAADDETRSAAATIAARQKFFGPENVDPRSGEVRTDRVIFSWITNAGYAASFRGRVVLLDTYINRFEVPPTSGPDLRRTPFGAQDLVDLHPEAIFLGHGHGDHADNAAYIAKWLNIPIYTTPETCDVMQMDVARMAADPNTVNGGAKLVPDANPVKCVGVVPRGSVPGTTVVHVDQLDPVACMSLSSTSIREPYPPTRNSGAATRSCPW